MVERNDLMGVAAVWGQAADRVGALTRDGADSWNAAIEHATQVLRKEADDVRAMNEMAHRIIVGNLR
ncbi:hypothetical protein [Actinophytocola oryzae]|uniref:Uncharacterized protein n=1 Tax=Actinophytocola oryzae TaxID=502181 RepID=A0A4R7VFP9_9PSEU|nr:hypothetical protein [Actinophytocola oryzae]TDV47879.1 hypothetical protein CLV71_109114 [Actinophytocola oryzae]